MTVWATPTQAETHWPDATALGETVLTTLLGIAQEVCAVYAPDLAETDPVPDRYMLAVIYQARELRAAAQRDGDVIGLGDGYALRSRPLTGAVKSLLRPASGVPVLG